MSLFFVDRTERGRLQVTGRDRQTFLQGMVSNDVAALKPGEGCYAFLLDSIGHVLADVRVLCVEDALLLDVESGMAPFVRDTLEKYRVMEKCRITDVTAMTAQAFLGGEDAPAALASLGVTGAAEWTEGRNAVAPLAGTDSYVAATRLIPGPGFDVYTTAPAVDLRAALTALGAEERTDADLEALRVEAGVPRFGRDMDRRVLAPETGQRARAISYRKGCYIGQEIVARIDARGHTNRALAGLRLEAAPDAAPPAPETPIFDEAGKEVGRVTSVARSARLEADLALGYLRNEVAAPGTAVTVAGRPAVVSDLPFAPQP